MLPKTEVFAVCVIINNTFQNKISLGLAVLPYPECFAELVASGFL